MGLKAQNKMLNSLIICCIILHSIGSHQATNVDDSYDENLYENSPKLSSENGAPNSQSKLGILFGAEKIAKQLQHISNEELGVKHLQESLENIPYVETKENDMDLLETMVMSLDEKYDLYSKLVKEMAQVIRKAQHLKSKKSLKSPPTQKSFVLDYVDEFDDERHQSQHYYPCCLIPDHYLRYDAHFGTRINTELWCDSGLRQDVTETSLRSQLAPYKLTNLFIQNHRLHPSIKWQYFLSSKGIHTEFPAHRPGTSVGSECGQSSRHHRVWESTVRSKGRNIVLLFDLGNTIRARLLLTAKAIGHYVTSTLEERDQIGVIGISKSISRPTAPCMKFMKSATHDVKRMIENFVDYMEMNDESTNHSLGLHTALDMVQDWATTNKNSSVLVMYVTRGWLSEDHMKDLMVSLGNRIDSVPANVIFSTYGLGVSLGETSIQRRFLEAIAHQQYSNYKVFPKKKLVKGEAVGLLPTLRVVPIMRNFYEVVDHATSSLSSFSEEKLNAYLNRKITVSEPYWDKEGHGMIVSFSEAIYTNDGAMEGVVGLDISLSHLLEDATYFMSPAESHALVIDEKGNVLSHPKMGRPETWKLPILPTPVTWLETSSFFTKLLSHILSLPKGRRISKRQKTPNEYLWVRSQTMNWTYIISRKATENTLWKISPKIPPIPSDAIYHRLDFLLPQQARVCRHFSQMSTLDAPTLFLPSGAYTNPTEQMGRLSYDSEAQSRLMEFLSNFNGTVRNPGIKEGVKEDVASLYDVTKLWQKLFRMSVFQKYIIRRYGATKSGAMFTYPGTLLDISYEPRTQPWFMEAMANPDHVIVSSPFLDPGGAGHIVTLSHAVLQGNNLLERSARTPVAVLAIDFTVNFWHKILADADAECAKSIYFEGSQTNTTETNEVRCFLVNTAGYIVSHSQFVDPFENEEGSVFPKHIAQQEPVLSTTLLSKPLLDHSESVLVKHWCGRWWHRGNQRQYTVNILAGDIISSPLEDSLKSDNSCLSYKLTRIPNTNLIVGIINQACSSSTAFCPCNTVDKRCLSCQVMEASACECPCECPLPVRPCRELSTKKPGKAMSSASEVLLGYQRSLDQTILASCDRQPEAPGMKNYGIGLLSQLPECVPVTCADYKNESDCLGVASCVWCVLESDKQNLLLNPTCSKESICYKGILGAGSPYPRGVAPMKHSEDREDNFPTAQVLGGCVGLLLLIFGGFYCYRTYVGTTSAATYTPTALQGHTHTSLPYPVEKRPIDPSNEGLLDDRILSVEAAAMSPYRMNPTYRRPAPQYGEPSDPGYSTMTPHDDNETGTVSLFPCPTDEGRSENWSDRSDKALDSPCHGSDVDCPIGQDPTGQTQLSSKPVGFNRILVTATVHQDNSG